MKVYVDSISIDGLELKEDIAYSKLSLGPEDHGINLTGDIGVKANFQKRGTELLVDISLKAPLECTCARCLAKIHDVFKKDFQVNYEVKPGDVVEVDEDIRQELILSYPMKALCKPDCKGLCPNCGQNLNVGECECDDTENRGQSHF